MYISNQKLEKMIVVAISIGFIIWSSFFIYRSSFIGIDGKRYFSLFDDAMISMRYADNLSHGLGLVWNSGVRIEGYTNLLMTLLMSFATLVFDKLKAVLFIQILGTIFMLAIAIVSVKITDDISQNKNRTCQPLLRVLTFLCVLAYYPLVYWSLMGMETGLLTLLLLLGVHSSFTYLANRQQKFLLLAAVCLGLAYLTRNDSVIFAVLVWSYISWEIRGKSRYKLLGAIASYLLFVAGQLIVRYVYYGELLPNTYTLKLVGMPLLLRIANGIRFVQPFLLEVMVLLVLSGVGVIIHFQRQKFLLFFLVLVAISYQVYVGGDAWDYWRIISPSVPLLFILFIDFAGTFLYDLSRRRSSGVGSDWDRVFPSKHNTRILLVSLILIGILSANMRFLHEISFLTKPFSSEFNQRNVNNAIVLDSVTTEDASLGVYWAGSIPYFTNRKSIDFLGKTDKYVAHLKPDVSGAISWGGMVSVPGHNKYDLNYSIATLLPTYVQGFVWGKQDLSQCAKTHYVEVDYEGIKLFLLKDSPAILWERINAAD